MSSHDFNHSSGLYFGGFGYEIKQIDKLFHCSVRNDTFWFRKVTIFGKLHREQLLITIQRTTLSTRRFYTKFEALQVGISRDLFVSVIRIYPHSVITDRDFVGRKFGHKEHSLIWKFQWKSIFFLKKSRSYFCSSGQSKYCLTKNCI